MLWEFGLRGCMEGLVGRLYWWIDSGLGHELLNWKLKTNHWRSHLKGKGMLRSLIVKHDRKGRNRTHCHALQDSVVTLQSSVVVRGLPWTTLPFSNYWRSRSPWMLLAFLPFCYTLAAWLYRSHSSWSLLSTNTQKAVSTWVISCWKCFSLKMSACRFHPPTYAVVSICPIFCSWNYNLSMSSIIAFYNEEQSRHPDLQSHWRTDINSACRRNFLYKLQGVSDLRTSNTACTNSPHDEWSYPSHWYSSFSVQFGMNRCLNT